MADETQVVREQEELRLRMDESREALTQKIERLEEKVTETVESATTSVAEATASVIETVHNATTSVSETVDSVTNAVQGTVDTVRHSVEGTVDSVKEAFDLSRQVGSHPWLMLAGAIGIGYVGGLLLPASSGRGRRNESTGSFGESSRTPREWDDHRVVARQLPAANGVHSNGSATGATPSITASGWLSSLGAAFGPEIIKLQELAVGTMLGSMRDLIVKSVPDPMQQPLAEVFDGVTEKLGGKCIHGSLVTTDVNSRAASSFR